MQQKPYIIIVARLSSEYRTLEFPLQAANMEVDVFKFGHDAMRAVVCRAPDCIVLDLDLPDFRELELFQWLRHGHPQVPVIIVAAENHHPRTRAAAGGCMDFFTGRVGEERFVEAVQRATWRRERVNDPFLPGRLNGLRLS